MEWFGKELDRTPITPVNDPPMWSHRHADGKYYAHAMSEGCHNIYTEESVLSPHVWAYLHNYDGGFQLISIVSEEEAARLAVIFLYTIYFFADEVSHPNSK